MSSNPQVQADTEANKFHSASIPEPETRIGAAGMTGQLRSGRNVYEICWQR